MNKHTPTLAGVPETMLWTLHHRVNEARRPNGLLHDPEACRILDAIDYDFAGHFGAADGSLASRAAAMDAVLRQWLREHPDGTVVSLGEGLETQALRVDNGRMHWLSVDLPAAMQFRELFLSPTERFHHIRASALDPGWMELVDAACGVFIVAQGLFMYLQPAQVQGLIVDLAERYPGGTLMFDTIPAWLSRLTLRGFRRTRHYRLPPMPWGINRKDIAPALQRWSAHIETIEVTRYQLPHGVVHLAEIASRLIPGLRERLPALVSVRFTSRSEEACGRSSPAPAASTRCRPTDRV